MSNAEPRPTRRLILTSAALGACGLLLRPLTGCAQDQPTPYEDYRRAAAAERGGGGYGSTTSADIEGPFYRKEAPFKAELAPTGEPGKRLKLTGRVVKGLECAPLAGAVLDVWQANAGGRYDNDDPARPPKGFHLRGRVRTDAEGRFELTTIWPGHYRIGPDTWRPAHLHLKATAEGCRPLTTQLYFEGDPHNEKDRWFDASRALKPAEGKDGVWTARYEVVLAAAKG